MNRGAVVVFGWAGFNALLTLVLVSYDRNDPFPLIVYALAVVLVGGFGLAVLRAARRARPERFVRIATRSTSAGFAAIAAAFIALGCCYGYWLMLLALGPILLSALALRTERLPAGVLRPGQPTPVGPDGQTPPQRLGSTEDGAR